MTSSLQVERQGHVNGGRNALSLAGGTCFELFAATRPDQAIGAWLAKQGPGWHSVEWTIPSLDDGIGALAEHNIRVTDHVPGPMSSRTRGTCTACASS